MIFLTHFFANHGFFYGLSCFFAYFAPTIDKVMNVTKVVLHDFRNYTDQSVDFCPSLNVIEGHNTAGKTNLVEAVYLCGIGKSPRGAKDKELIRLGENCAHVTAFVQKKYRSHRIDVHLAKEGKSIAIDGVAISKMADLMGVLNVIFFSPDELKIVKEDPGERRRFINIGLCQQNKQYFANLSKYNRILEQRNAQLKEAKTMDQLAAMLPVWDAQLAEEGAKIILARQDFMRSLQEIADPIHRSIAGETCDLQLMYTPYPYTEYLPLRDYLLSKLQNSYEKEWNTRYTLVGPHRDDFVLQSEGKDLRIYGSQGQQRTAALVLKLAEISYFEKNTGEKPVLLLDDVLSELDEKRRISLLESTQGIQTLLTCTEFEEKTENIGKIIRVRQGNIAE